MVAVRHDEVVAGAPGGLQRLAQPVERGGGRFREGDPVFPGVLLVEGMAQTAGAICVLSAKAMQQPKNVFFLTIDKAKFRKPVVPGDTIEYHMQKIAI